MRACEGPHEKRRAAGDWPATVDRGDDEVRSGEPEVWGGRATRDMQ